MGSWGCRQKDAPGSPGQEGGTAMGTTVTEKIERERGAMIARLAVLDPNGARSGWTVRDSFRDLLASFEWLVVRESR